MQLHTKFHHQTFGPGPACWWWIYLTIHTHQNIHITSVASNTVYLDVSDATETRKNPSAFFSVFLLHFLGSEWQGTISGFHLPTWVWGHIMGFPHRLGYCKITYFCERQCPFWLHFEFFLDSWQNNMTKFKFLQPSAFPLRKSVQILMKTVRLKLLWSRLYLSESLDIAQKFVARPQ